MDMQKWQQGRTLFTEQTRTWSPEEWAGNEAHERKRVYRFFSALDQGQARILVASCTLAEDAATIVREHNAEVMKRIAPATVGGSRGNSRTEPCYGDAGYCDCSKHRAGRRQS